MTAPWVVPTCSAASTKPIGDRTKSLDELAGGVWDAAVAVAGYHPAVISRSLDGPGGRVGRYLFVSVDDQRFSRSAI